MYMCRCVCKCRKCKKENIYIQKYLTLHYTTLHYTIPHYITLLGFCCRAFLSGEDERVTEINLFAGHHLSLALEYVELCGRIAGCTILPNG